MEVLREVFRRPRYVVGAFVGTVFGFLIISYAVQGSLIDSLFDAHVSGIFPVIAHILVSGIYASGGIVALGITLVLSILWGVLISLQVFYMRHFHTMRLVTSSGVRGILALVGGVVSAGCWGCGGFLLAPLLGLVVGGTSVFLLYVGGVIVSGVSVFLLGYSLYKVIRSIHSLPLFRS